MPRLLGPTAVSVAAILARFAPIPVTQQLSGPGPVPSAVREWSRYALLILSSWQIIAGFALAFAGAVIYLFAISHPNISYLYPFASLSFPAVLLAGVLVLGSRFPGGRQWVMR